MNVPTKYKIVSGGNVPYKKNEALHDALKTNPTFGLPLFREQSKSVSKRIRYMIEHAPKAIRIATDTRKLSHIALTFDPDILNRKQLCVLNAFVELCKEYGDATNEEVRIHLKTEINHVVGRTFELRQKGVVGFSQKRKCRITGYVVSAWTVNLSAVSQANGSEGAL